MSAPAKKRAGCVAVRDVDEELEILPNEEIRVDFEGRTPQDLDFHGIKMLLQQLFLKAHVNLSELSNTIIGQNYIGSVIKQADQDIPDDDSEEDPEETNNVFGITTIVSLNAKQELECVHQMRELLLELAEKHSSDHIRELVRRVLNINCALLLNERLVNIPAQISAPLFESLKEEIHRAKEKDKDFNFEYYFMICKLYKPENTKSSSKKNQDLDIIWSNAEEEVIEQDVVGSFEFSVKNEIDSAFTGKWLEDDPTLTPYRKILVIDAKKFDKIVDTVKAYVT